MNYFDINFIHFLFITFTRIYLFTYYAFILSLFLSLPKSHIAQYHKKKDFGRKVIGSTLYIYNICLVAGDDCE